MTTLLAKLDSVKSTKDIHELQYEYLRWFNKHPILDWLARHRRRDIVRRRNELFETIFNN